VHQPEDPVLYAWQGAALFARQQQRAGRYHSYAVTREEYLELGHAACARKFGN
jgi:actin-related protein